MKQMCWAYGGMVLQHTNTSQYAKLAQGLVAGTVPNIAVMISGGSPSSAATPSSAGGQNGWAAENGSGGSMHDSVSSHPLEPSHDHK